MQMQQGWKKLPRRSELSSTTEMLDWAYIYVKESWSHMADFLVTRSPPSEYILQVHAIN